MNDGMLALALRRCLLVFATLFAIDALSAVPTEEEWQAWPRYCQARFVVAGDATNTDYPFRVSESEIAQWRAQLGRAWEPMHHYCYGLLFLSRAALERDETARRHLLQNAIAEFRFSYRYTDQIDPSSFFFGEYVWKLGESYMRLGEIRSAAALADNTLASAPAAPVGYLLKASILREQRKLEDAVDVLERGLETARGGTAELHYTLGLVLVDLGRYEQALEHARQAYAFGYPLPGLRNRLARQGYRIDAGHTE